MRDGRLADVEAFDDLADAHRSGFAGEQVEDQHSRRVAERPEPRCPFGGVLTRDIHRQSTIIDEWPRGKSSVVARVVRGCQPRTERSASRRDGTSRYQTHSPRFSRSIRPGVDENLHVVADRRLRTARRLGQVACAHLVALRGSDVAQQSKPDRIGERRERRREQLRLCLVEDVGVHRRAAGDRVEQQRSSKRHGQLYRRCRTIH